MENNKPQRKKIKFKTIFWLLFLAIILGILAGFSYYVLDIYRGRVNIQNLYSDPNNSQNTIKTPAGTYLNQILVEGEGKYSIGPKKPKMTIVVFLDYECPYCQASFPIIREISLTYKNDIRIIERFFPVHENSNELALAALCADEQNLFWSMNDMLFQKQGTFNLTELNSLAARLGINEKQFNTCREQKKYLSILQKDYSDAQQLGVTGTPTWFFDGRKVAGEIPKDLLIKLIETKLAE
ncbi:MAG: thioredoxin domain-containing protein [Planctomycetes bacterium]|jgi:protein-disulfide isomerase|nr:thioredoxin domain-containing protein [Planctomycetota bacterium]